MSTPTMDYVLVVDDEPDAREVLERIINALGFETRTAQDGLEALEQINKGLPLLILLDLMMPKLDGFKVLSTLRSHPATRQLPVVIVTACSRDQIDMLRLPGVRAVLQKGCYSIKDLRGVISTALEAASVCA